LPDFSPSAYSHTGDQDLAYLARLLGDFGLTPVPPPELALRLVAERHRALLRLRSEIGASIEEQARWGESLSRLLRRWATWAHEIMYDGLLTNAGRARQASDPGGGAVYFGGQHGQRRTWKFKGVPPAEIEDALDTAFAWLRLDADDPVRAAVLFYADFVRIHPFYDANGRIGRLVVSVYLDVHGIHVEWAKIDERQSKFIKKLNECHKRHDQPHKLDSYRYFLVDFFRRHTLPHDAFYDPDAP
jgi:fido (protein-threonine AMPylation protein)